MNLQSLVVVVLRLMALNFLLQVAVHLTPQILRLSEMGQRSVPGVPPLQVALPWLLINGLIVGAILLWVFAFPIARLVTSGVPHDLSFGTLSLVDCYSVAFMGVGLLYIVNHLPQVLNWTHYLFKAATSTSGDIWKEQVQWYEVSQSFIPFVVGVVLFVKGRKWAIALARRHTEVSPSVAKVGEKTDADK